MADTKIEVAAKEEAVKETAKEEIVEKALTPAEKVADAISDRIPKEPAFGPDEEAKDAEPSEEDKEKEASEPESESATDEKTDEAEELKEETPEDDEAVAHVKASMQKRIDKLTAEKKATEERLAKIEAKLDKPEDKKEPVYTKEQLKAATKKFMEEGDSDGMFEIMEYMARQETKALKNEYLNEQKRIREEAEAKQREWNSVTMHYSNDEDPTLDIRKPNSTLYKVAKQFYEDPEIGPTYLLPGGGGMLQAVADAHAEILKYRADKGVKEKKPIIKAKEVKERRKTSMAGTGSMKPERTVPKSSGNDLDDYLAERKSALASRKGLITGD